LKTRFDFKKHTQDQLTARARQEESKFVGVLGIMASPNCHILTLSYLAASIKQAASMATTARPHLFSQMSWLVPLVRRLLPNSFPL
jgi:hypothetical protein